MRPAEVAQVPEYWKTDENYNQDQRALSLIQERYSTDKFDFGRDWGGEENGVSPSIPELHSKIEELYAKKIKEYPSTDQPVLILMAGASGIGKTAKLNSYLEQLNDFESPEHKKLCELAGISEGAVRGESFIILSHRDVKEEMCDKGGVQHIPEDWWSHLGDDIAEDHSYRTENRNDLKSAAIHTESSWLMDKVAEACIEARKSIAYDVSVTRPENLEYLLTNADKHGYARVAISVEGSMEQALEGNYKNWQDRMIISPVGVIEKSYADGRDGQSICRQNIRGLADGEEVLMSNGTKDWYRYLDAVIEVNRGSSDMGSRPGQGVQKDLTQAPSPQNPVAPFASDLLTTQHHSGATRRLSEPGASSSHPFAGQAPSRPRSR
ncbi:hypothetical protein PV387_32420 [Streptomyces sp. ME02-6987-2C]|uniref:hypothetical protein n=1 Tax=unclassified Streptomyces TaxID=2593676 RepID=UPI0029B515C9|nr:hypothetical protein [Streptomyces sp. ME02-6987-2C]MDX3370661.1 hypothetical protein [Streptomyces sp. ME02-6987-2C]